MQTDFMALFYQQSSPLGLTTIEVRPKINFRLYHKVLIATVVVCSVFVETEAYAQKVLVESPENSSLVEVEKPFELNLPYKERRTLNGFMVSIQNSQILMNNFTTIENNTELFYEDLYGNGTRNSPELYLGYKLNMPIGSLGLDLGMASMSLKDDLSGVERELSFQKKIVRASIYFDMFFSEPYAVPYFSYSAWKMSIKESNPTSSVSYDTGMGHTLTGGVLIQLNFLDPESSAMARKEYGFENIFLDLYAFQQSKTSDASDPDTSTDINYGFGIRFEF